MTREQEILNHMKILGISREEAKQLYEDDHSDEVLPEVAEMEKKAKENGRTYFQSDKERKPSTRKKEIDPEKTELIQLLNYCLLNPDAIGKGYDYEITDVSVLNPQREIIFNVGASEYSITLTKHRKKGPKK